MRIFITSTPDELEPCQHAAIDIVRQLGHEPVVRAPVARRGLDPVTACGRQIAFADVVLAIVGWRRGLVPSAALGGDGLRPWSVWEVESAFEQGVPVVALLADEGFAPQLREEEPEAHAVMTDFRGELARLAAVFEAEADFRRLASETLREAERASQSVGTLPPGLHLRRHPPPELPSLPYPLLLPYTHPELMAGRGEDLASLCRTLERPVPVVGLHAVSGTGKSSLLAGGLVPMLRAAGRLVAFERHATEPNLSARLLMDLVESEAASPAAGVVDAHSFVDRLLAVRKLAGGAAPVLVIDQFEDLLEHGAEAARATLGPLLAASAQRLPGQMDPPCRWLLAYRQEVHGRLVEWLEDVLRDARDLGAEGLDRLPHDLSGPTRFLDFPLTPLGTPPAGSGDAAAASARVFLHTIEKPLAHDMYPWVFAPGHAERLALAFAEARVRRPEAPLVPELQVVLAHLLEQAGESTDGKPVTVTVPEEPGAMIDRALEEHLGRALDFAFPHGLHKAARTARTRALLVLRELADAHGQRGEGRAGDVLAAALGDVLAAALGEEGRDVLEKFATPQTRLVVRERHGNAWTYALAHDRLAEVLVRVVDEGRWAGLGIDAELLGLRRFVVLQSRLYASGDVDSATLVPSKYWATIEGNQEVLFWSDQHRVWWEAALTRHRRERRQRMLRWAIAAVVVGVVALSAFQLSDQRAQQQALLEDIAIGKPEEVFAALDTLTGSPSYVPGRARPGEILDQLRKRENPFDCFESGLGGVEEERRAETLVRVAEFTLPILEESPEDPVLIASLVWALDFFAIRDPMFSEEGKTLRAEVLGPLRRSRPPPPPPAADDPNWANIPAGTFWMGADSDEWCDDEDRKDECPRHQVTLSAFRMMTHEVTNVEYLRLFPDYVPRRGDGDRMPAMVTWYEAYTFAAWLGGRLPTEAEWEYAARAYCVHTYCKRDGSRATAEEVGWWSSNTLDIEKDSNRLWKRPVMLLEPNRWGLWDVYGNLPEWTASWYSNYMTAPKRDPPGPTGTSQNQRTGRGGYLIGGPKTASSRLPFPPTLHQGFRPVIMESMVYRYSGLKNPDQIDPNL